MSTDDFNCDQSITESTPSPAATPSNTPATSNSTSSNSQSNNASRRPPRKSTLTQQQKNQKRQRATQDQLVTLENEFTKNPTPTAATRERIAQEINMTERSVQIWFQNSRRRAKIKAMAKKSIEGGEDLDESMRQLLAIQAMEAGKPFPPHFMARPGHPMGQYGMGGMPMGGDPNGSGKVVIQHFTCRSLSIGSWRRVGQNAMDLVIFYSPDKACITYYINNDSAGYKIEFPFAYINNITLEAGDSQPVNGSTPRPGGLVIELTRPPNFFMDSSGSGGFYQCGDFTEDQQASQILVHHLGGHPKVLSGQLAKLVSLDSYQNRHQHFDTHAIPASAPVSPTMGIPRPASQPNVHFARPHPPHVGMFQEAHFGINPHLNGMRMHPGHKRQRSRSVPAAIDFSMLHGPMPTFHIQQPSPQFHPHDNQHMFHPMPHHPIQGPMGPNLQIDTSAPYGLEFRQVPMSATATSPSEFASPGFFPSANQQQTPMAPPDFSTPYSMPFLSPSPMVDPSHMIPPSVSPLSHMSHGEPAIADNSPPMSGMHRSASADMFSMGHDPSLHDESIMLSEMYSKQNLNMQIPGPSFDESSMMGMTDMSSDFHTPREHLEMGMNPFGTVDPNSLQAAMHR